MDTNQENVQTSELAEAAETSNIFVTFILSCDLYAVEATYVREITQYDKLTESIDERDYVKGVINLRGNVIPVIDLRVKLGMPTYDEQADELIETLHLREEDHVNWLHELEACVKEEREFALQTDPHKCAFGKWYDKFECKDETLMNYMRRFDAPHKTIHGVAAKVLQAAHLEGKEKALEIIEATRDNELTLMIRHFRNARETVTSGRKMVLLVVEVEGKKTGLMVDSMNAVIEFSQDKIGPVPSITESSTAAESLLGIAKHQTGDEEDLFKIIDPFKVTI